MHPEIAVKRFADVCGAGVKSVVCPRRFFDLVDQRVISRIRQKQMVEDVPVHMRQELPDHIRRIAVVVRRPCDDQGGIRQRFPCQAADGEIAFEVFPLRFVEYFNLISAIRDARRLHDRVRRLQTVFPCVFPFRREHLDFFIHEVAFKGRVEREIDGEFHLPADAVFFKPSELFADTSDGFRQLRIQDVPLFVGAEGEAPGADAGTPFHKLHLRAEEILGDLPAHQPGGGGEFWKRERKDFQLQRVILHFPCVFSGAALQLSRFHQGNDADRSVEASRCRSAAVECDPDQPGSARGDGDGLRRVHQGERIEHHARILPVGVPDGERFAQENAFRGEVVPQSREFRDVHREIRMHDNPVGGKVSGPVHHGERKGFPLIPRRAQPDCAGNHVFLREVQREGEIGRHRKLSREERAASQLRRKNLLFQKLRAPDGLFRSGIGGNQFLQFPAQNFRTLFPECIADIFQIICDVSEDQHSEVGRIIETALHVRIRTVAARTLDTEIEGESCPAGRRFCKTEQGIGDLKHEFPHSGGKGARFSPPRVVGILFTFAVSRPASAAGRHAEVANPSFSSLEEEFRHIVLPDGRTVFADCGPSRGGGQTDCRAECRAVRAFGKVKGEIIHAFPCLQSGERSIAA